MDYRDISQQLTGRWDEVLSMYGIEVPKLKGKNTPNHPCPICGGTDRAHWRDVDGRLALYCRSCAADKMKSPEDVIMEACNINFVELSQNLADFVGHIEPEKIHKAKVRAKAAPQRNTPIGHKQDHDASIAFLAKCSTAPKHKLLNRFSVQYPTDIHVIGGAIIFPVVNEAGVVVNLLSVSEKDGQISTTHCAGGFSYGAWHVVPRCSVRNPPGIAWTVSVIDAIRNHWRTGVESRACIDINNMIWMINVGVIKLEDTIMVSDSDRELLPIIE